MFLYKKLFYHFFIILTVFNNFQPLFGQIEKYFKKIPSDKTCKSIKNVDFIYLINLDKRPEKLAHTLAQLAPYSIVPYRFSAVNGWELPLDVINDVGIKLKPWMRKVKGTSYLPENNGRDTHELPIKTLGQTFFAHCMSRGAIGIVLSHLSILQDAYNSGYETIWVMEDDIEVLRNPHILSDLINKMDLFVGKNKWDIFFTDKDTKDQTGNYIISLGYTKRPNFIPLNEKQFYVRTIISSELRRVGSRFGTYSMIIRRFGIKKILDFFKTYQIFSPYDMDIYLAPGIRMYSVINDVVSTLTQATSDNGDYNYKKQKTLSKKQK